MKVLKYVAIWTVGVVVIALTSMWLKLPPAVAVMYGLGLGFIWAQFLVSRYFKSV